MPDRPEIGNYVRIRFSEKFNRVVFYVHGHGSYGVKPNKKTEKLQKLINEVYAETVSMNVEL